MTDDRAAFLAEIGTIRSDVNAVLQGHDGGCIIAVCTELIAKWILTHDDQQQAMNAHLDLLAKLIDLLAAVKEDDGYANLKH